jgi:vacuolar-type H+-ATPase subunit H
MIIAHTSHIGSTGLISGVRAAGGSRVPRRTPVDAVTDQEDVAPEELLGAAIPIVRRGYSPDVVDGLLDRAATTIERLRALDDPELELHRREQADLLHRTLLLAEASADQRVAEAESLAASVVAEARARAGRLVVEAEQAATQFVQAEQTRAALTLGEAQARRQVLQADIEVLEQHARDLRARLRSVFDQAAALDRVLAEATETGSPRREIDLTDPVLAHSDGADAGPAWRDDDGEGAMVDVIDDEPVAVPTAGAPAPPHVPRSARAFARRG